MPPAVPAPPAELASVAQDLASTPRQPLGARRRGDQPVTDGQQASTATDRAGHTRARERRRWAAALAWPVRGRATLIRRHVPQALSLPDRPGDQPRPRTKPASSNEPTTSLMAPK